MDGGTGRGVCECKSEYHVSVYEDISGVVCSTRKRALADFKHLVDEHEAEEEEERIKRVGYRINLPHNLILLSQANGVDSSENELRCQLRIIAYTNHEQKHGNRVLARGEEQEEHVSHYTTIKHVPQFILISSVSSVHLLFRQMEREERNR